MYAPPVSEAASMTELLYTCPSTHQRAPSGITSDAKSLRASWSKMIKINCKLCGEVHRFKGNDIFCESVLQDWKSRDEYRPV
jgi:hypothetical protein